MGYYTNKEQGSSRKDLANHIRPEDSEALTRGVVACNATGDHFEDYLNAVATLKKTVEDVTFNDELSNNKVDRSSSHTVATVVAEHMLNEGILFDEHFSKVEADLAANEAKRNPTRTPMIEKAAGVTVAATEIGQGLKGLGATHRGATGSVAIPSDRGNPVKAEKSPFDGLL